MKRTISILFSLCTLYIHAFKIDRVILSTDTNPDYIEFWPVAAKAWKELIGIKPTLALIAPKNITVDESLGDVIRFEPIDGIPTAMHAQVIRLLLPAYFEDEVCIVSDIDLIPLNKEYFLNSVAKIEKNKFVVYRDGAYHGDPDKFPMCFVAALGKTFKEIFNIKTIDDIPNIIKQWHSKKLGWYTDEYMLHTYVTSWNKYGTHCIKLGHDVEKRIDRSCWNYHDQLLKNGQYIDMHCPRPYSTHKKSIDSIVETVLNTQKNKSLPKPRFLDGGDYGSHMAPLLTIAMHTNGPILEMGAGDFSTPLLHAVCSKNKRTLVTADTDKRWLSYFIDLKREWHNFMYVPVYEDDWEKNPKPYRWNHVGSDTHWSLVFIDHRPGERRAVDIMRLRKNTDIFVVHDTQQPSYGYEPALQKFKYRYVYTRYSTQTTIVSDTIDVAKFFEGEEV